MYNISSYHTIIVIGSSRGLGLQLCIDLTNQNYNVIGISRSSSQIFIQNIRNKNMFTYLQCDISNQEAVDLIKETVKNNSLGPICVIFNCAILKPDIEEAQKINIDCIKDVNNVGISGFVNTIDATQDYLLKNGGKLVAISSYAALNPPAINPSISYAASKAYLDMACRSLRQHWKNKVLVSVVHVGVMTYNCQNFPRNLIMYSYKNVSKEIITKSICVYDDRCSQIDIGFLYKVIYRCLLPILGDNTYFMLFKNFLSRVRSGN